MLSVRKAVRKLVRLGELKAIPPGKNGRSSHYIYALPLVSTQRELPLNQVVGDSNKGLPSNPISVENSVENKEGVTRYRITSAQEKGYLVTPNLPEPPKHKTKTPRDTPARPPAPPSEQDQKRRIEGRERRVMQEVGILQDNLACMDSGLEPEIQRTIFRIADKMKTLQPLSEAEYERRRDDQKQRLAAHLKAKGMATS